MNENEIIELLSEVVDPEFLKVWIHIPNKAFGGKKPIDLEREQLENMAFRLRSGMPG
jgi:hypothetical protein